MGQLIPNRKNRNKTIYMIGSFVREIVKGQSVEMNSSEQQLKRFNDLSRVVTRWLDYLTIFGHLQQ